jgi:hypothetical protein
VQTIVYIDGFNLYYGACREQGRRWLNLGALATRLLPHDQIDEIRYFTANIKRDPDDLDAQDRQRLYHRALRTIPNLEIVLGRFIAKRVRGWLVELCPGERPLKRTVMIYEEKGTDVNLATRLLVDGFEGRFESATVISNDGDLKMPIQVIREQLNLPVTVVNPVLRSRRSAALSPDPLPANASFIRLSARDVIDCQFPNQLMSPKGARLVKPAGW